MKAVVQRVNSASVTVEGKTAGSIGRGLLVFIGFGISDTDKTLEAMCEKICSLRLFPSGEKESELSVKDIGGEILLVSQFTLYGDVKKGKRPSFSMAMKPAEAKIFYEKLQKLISERDIIIKSGIFQSMMKVSLENDGPYTIIIELE